ncbi:MAG TPA: hypothetical protein PKN56_09525 [Leptospiraceae bacterium]|nr:hypothetical protein [Leptospiraceae bacterium]
MKKKDLSYEKINDKLISDILQNLKKDNKLIWKVNPDSKELCKDFTNKTVPSSDNYDILGAFEFSPIQYVRARLDHFLESNGISEDDRLDTGIATIEAIENAVKYGDGRNVNIQAVIEGKKLKLSITNYIKEFDLESEIERGKYSVSTTLMRGIMVMQKLFSHTDLQILEDKRQARLYAEKIFN